MRVIKQLIDVLLDRGRLTRGEIDRLRQMGLIEPPPDLATRLAMHIDDLDLTVRTYNILMREGVRTIGELVDLTASDLLGFRNFLPKCVDEVRYKLHAIGLSLRSERDPDSGVDDVADAWDAHADGLLGKTRGKRDGRREGRKIARARRRHAIGRIHNG